MTVVDASVVVRALIEGDHTLLGGGPLHAPELIDLEVLNALRSHEMRGELTGEDTAAALAAFDGLAIEKHAHRHVLRRVWQLRGNLTPYDGAYVALAELWGSPLRTADRRLANAPGIRCEVEVIEA